MLAGSPDKHWQSLQLHQIESTPWFFQRSCCLVQASPTEESQPQICRPSEWSMATSDAFQTTSNYFSRWCVMGTPRAGKWIEGPLQHLYGTLEPWEEFVDVKSLPLSKEWAVDAFSLIYKWCNFEITESPNPWNSCLEDPHVVGKSRIQVLGRIDDHLAGTTPKCQEFPVSICLIRPVCQKPCWPCRFIYNSNSSKSSEIILNHLHPSPTILPGLASYEEHILQLDRAFPEHQKMHAVNERTAIYWAWIIPW